MKHFNLTISTALVSILICGQVFAQSNSQALNKIQRVQDLIKTTYSQGLIYSLYFNPAVDADLAAVAATNNMTVLDSKLSAIVSRVASDLSRGRVLPTSVPDKASIAVKPFQHQLIAGNYLNSAMTPLEFINAVIPKNRLYKEAQKVVETMVDLKARNAWASKPADLTLATVNKKTKKPALISHIRACLENFGYSNNRSSTVYDSNLETAIKSFQSDNGLVADGVAGNITWSYLEKSLDQLMTQAMLNLDRSRWLPNQNASEYIYVNLAKQTFQYFENEVATLSFKTVNGRLDRATPLLVDQAREVVLNPTWTVPRSIFVKDKIPKLREDSSWSLNAHMVMYSDIDGSMVDPRSIDWNLPAQQLPYTLVQSPGPWNALGFIKFPLTNGFAIYMHDTNERNLFSETNRLRSSGCMRLEKPFEVAAKLLINTKWTVDELKAASELSLVQAQKPSSISLKRSVPVYAAYRTLNSENGRLLASNDPYGIDKAMYNVLISGK